MLDEYDLLPKSQDCMKNKNQKWHHTIFFVYDTETTSIRQYRNIDKHPIFYSLKTTKLLKNHLHCKYNKVKYFLKKINPNDKIHSSLFMCNHIKTQSKPNLLQEEIKLLLLLGRYLIHYFVLILAQYQSCVCRLVPSLIKIYIFIIYEDIYIFD